MLEVFKNPKYRACTIFVSISAALNQFSGINAVNIDCTTILEEVPGLNITLANDMLQVTSVIGAAIGPVLNRFFSIKNLLVIGELLIFTELALVAVF